jgi:hypothetical protein
VGRGQVRIGLIVLLVLFIPLDSYSSTFTKIPGLSCSTYSPSQTLGFNQNPNDTIYADYDVLVTFNTCGEYVNQGIGVYVGAAINFGGYQSAKSFYFTFENAWLWTPQSGCESGLLTRIQPAIELKLNKNASNSGLYSPPLYSGEGTLCFTYPDSFKPAFLVVYSNGTMVNVPLRNDQTYRLNVTESPPLQSSLPYPLIVTLAAIAFVFGAIQLYFGSIRDFIVVLGSPEEKGRVVQELKALRRRKQVKKEVENEKKQGQPDK